MIATTAMITMMITIMLNYIPNYSNNDNDNATLRKKKYLGKLTSTTPPLKVIAAIHISVKVNPVALPCSSLSRRRHATDIPLSAA